MTSTYSVHARILRVVHAAEASAMRVDDHALHALHRSAASDGDLLAFLVQAKRLVIGLAAAVHAVLHAHRGFDDRYETIGCRECGTSDPEPCRTIKRLADVLALDALRQVPVVDAAEAWRRAHRHWLGSDRQTTDALSSVSEITNGYVIRRTYLALPTPPAIPSPETEQVLIVDKDSAHIVAWPLMPLTVLDRQYQRFRKGEPMFFDPIDLES